MVRIMSEYDDHLRAKAEWWREFAKLAGSADERARRERLAKYFQDLADKNGVNGAARADAPAPAP